MKILRLFFFSILLIFATGNLESKAKKYEVIKVNNIKKIKVELFDIVGIKNLHCKPVFVRAKIIKIDAKRKITFLKVVSKTYRGLLFVLNFVIREKKGKHLVGMICRQKRQFAFYSVRGQ
ncbi:hypothetical protein [Hippea alviniae]|uniref:hypothetical protein n=1 Tax=Hippea alviniae TaxID=1279027 RepID=UPI0003B38E6F|nr:hypothetical protein [Hippea alviniae]